MSFEDLLNEDVLNGSDNQTIKAKNHFEYYKICKCEQCKIIRQWIRTYNKLGKINNEYNSMSEQYHKNDKKKYKKILSNKNPYSKPVNYLDLETKKEKILKQKMDLNESQRKKIIYRLNSIERKADLYFSINLMDLYSELDPELREEIKQ